MTTFCTYLPMSVWGEAKEKHLFLDTTNIPHLAVVVVFLLLHVHSTGCLTMKELAFFLYQQEYGGEKDVVVC